MNEMLLLAELLKKHRLETQEKDKRVAELKEELFKQSQESKEEVSRAIEIILEKDAKIAELEHSVQLKHYKLHKALRLRDSANERIAELEKALTELKAYKSKLLAHVKYSSTQEEVEIIKLEQQAKGLEDFAQSLMFRGCLENSFNKYDADEAAIELRSQAKALKEQDK